MLASRATGVILHTLGKQPGDLTAHQGGTEFDLLNEAGETMYAAWPWKFNERSARPLHLIKGQPWVSLPPDFGELLAEPMPRDGVLQSLAPTGYAELLELRASAVHFDGFTHWYAVEHAIPENQNLLGASENFASSPTWTVSLATVTSNTSVSPTGKTDADTLAASGSNAGRVFQDIDTDDLSDRSVYVASLYLKAGTATINELELQQQGAAATPETTTRAPKTVLRVTWAAGVPSVALQSSQGAGAHDVGVETIADGWFRVRLAITLDLSMDLPNEEIRFGIRPDAVGTTGNVLAWGAQLERFDPSAENQSPVPSAYAQNAGDPVTVTLPPVRRLAIYPTPTTTVLSAFACYYRRAWRPITSALDTIEIPSWIDGLFLEFCRAAARGAFEEDDAFSFQRYDALCRSELFKKKTDHDHGAQRSYGAMRTAADSLSRGGRDWDRGNVPAP